jgi:hypothetical protein
LPTQVRREDYTGERSFFAGAPNGVFLQGRSLGELVRGFGRSPFARVGQALTDARGIAIGSR